MPVRRRPTLMGRKALHVSAFRPINTRYRECVAQTGWKIWWAKRRWYERNHRLARRLRIDRHAARGGFFVRYPVRGRSRGARRGPAADRRRNPARARLLADPRARGGDRDRRGLLPQPGHDDRRPGKGHDRRSRDVRQQLLRRRRRAPLRRSRAAGHLAGLHLEGPVEIGANTWFGVNCAVTSGVSVGERCVVGANSVVTRDLPDRHSRRCPGEAAPSDHYKPAGVGEGEGEAHGEGPGPPPQEP